MRARQRAFRLPPAFDRSPAIEKPKAPTPVPGHHLVCLALAASVLLNVALLHSGTGAEPRAPPQAGGGVRGHGSFAPAAAAATTDHSLCHVALKSRADLPRYLNDLGLTGEGVEVGVRRAHFSEHVLQQWKGRVLHLVDPWEHQDAVDAKTTGGKYQDVSNAPNAEHAENLEHVKRTLSRFGSRFAIHRKYSVSAAREFADNTLDFVYVDARHEYEGCLEDLKAWYPKLRKGGLVSGHDFVPDCAEIKSEFEKATEHGRSNHRPCHCTCSMTWRVASTILSAPAPVDHRDWLSFTQVPDGFLKEGAFGVQRAATEFAKAVGREVQSISTKTRSAGREEPQRVDGGWTTFYWIK